MTLNSDILLTLNLASVSLRTSVLASDETLADDDDNDNDNDDVDRERTCYKWRVDLMKTQPHWENWFRGMSKKFLILPVAKILILSCISKLDRELNIGNMQGRFQLQVLAKCGHCIQEDRPDELASVIANFLIRHKISKAPKAVV